MPANLFNVDPVKLEQIGKLDSVDDAQGVKLIDTRDDFLVFNLGDPRIGDKKFLVTLGLGNPVAIILHFPYRNVEAIA